MYKNFIITESEKEEILNKHKNMGYAKPINENTDLSMNNNDQKYIIESIREMLKTFESKNMSNIEIATTLHKFLQKYIQDTINYWKGKLDPKGEHPKKFIDLVNQIGKQLKN